MSERNSYCHGLRFDQLINIATDNVSGYIPAAEFAPHGPPLADFFLLSDGTDFQISDGTNFLLS